MRGEPAAGGSGGAQRERPAGQEGALAQMPQRLRGRSPSPMPGSDEEGGQERGRQGRRGPRKEGQEEAARGGGEPVEAAERADGRRGTAEVPMQPSAAELAQMKEVARRVDEMKLRVKDLQAILRRNDQSRSGRRVQLVWRVADAKVRGRLPLCPRCEGHLDIDPTKSFAFCRGRWSDGCHRPCSYQASRTERLPFVEGSPM